MNIENLRVILENRQIGIYFGVVVISVFVGLIFTSATALHIVINPALALMLLVTFLQVPLADLKHAFLQNQFMTVLIVVNFIVIPSLVAILILFLPPNPMLKLGVLMVLLTPCIDYVVTFSHLGRADARLLLAATPVLLIMQMLLLPVYLSLFLGKEAANLIQFAPFVHAFVWLIAIPLMLAAFMKKLSDHNKVARQVTAILGLLPVPAMAFVLFVVIASVVPQLSPVAKTVLDVIPTYIAFAIFAPVIGWFVARIFKVVVPASRAIAFSAGTRNSLVILPLAFAVPNAVPILPAIIVTQTLIELVSQLFYVQLVAKLGRECDDQK